jgi:hypothetical protein
MTPNENTVAMMTEAQVQEPKSTVGVFTLPCGYLDSEGVLHTEVLVNEITGREEDMLAGNKVPDQKKMSQLITACVGRIGSITERSKIAAAIPDMLIGDRIFLLLAIRRTSLGDNYPYADQCPSCKQESLMSINLGELEVTPMPDPKKRIYDVRMPSKKACREWADTGELPASEAANPTGHTVRFRPVNGADEERMGQVQNKEEALSKQLAIRVELINGKPPDVETMQVLSLAERMYLRDVVFDRVDGGVETTLDVTCPKCSHDYKRELDIKQMGFFFPSAARRSWKTRSST